MLEPDLLIDLIRMPFEEVPMDAAIAAVIAATSSPLSADAGAALDTLTAGAASTGAFAAGSAAAFFAARFSLRFAEPPSIQRKT